MHRLFDYLVEAIRSPREQLTRGQNKVRYAWELVRHCGRELHRHRAEGMAAELTYRTIFSLIPVVVLGLVMFRVFGGLEDVQVTVENQLYSFFGVPEISSDYANPDGFAPDSETTEEGDSETGDETIPAGSDDLSDSAAEFSPPAFENQPLGLDPAGDAASNADAGGQSDGGTASAGAAQSTGDTSAPSAAAPLPTAQTPTDEDDADDDSESKRQARASIRNTLHQMVDQISSLDFKSIGVVGLLLFIYAAVALADSVEHLFNRIFGAPSQRSILIRVAIHWSIITLGSGLLALSLYMSSQVIDWFGTMGAGSTITLILRHLLSIAASWVLLFLLYALMPNTHVSIPAAAWASLVAALLWEAAKFGFQIYVTTAVPYSALYGSLGLIPLFLFWVYVTWWIVLFGMILTYSLQTLRGRRPSREERDDLIPGDPDWMLPIMTEVARAFDQGDAIDRQEVADRLGLTGRIVQEMSSKLVEADLLRRVEAGAGGEEALSLAKPADRISVRQILEIAHGLRPASNHPAWQLLANLKRAEISAADGKTLDDLIRDGNLNEPAKSIDAMP